MKIGFIGGGNMAYAIAGGVVKAGLCDAGDIYVSDPIEAAHGKFQDLGISTDANNMYALSGDIIILAIKPFIYPTALKALAENAKEELKDKVFVSIAAGISVKEIKEYLGFDAKVIRVMPNTPAMVLAGMSVLAEPISPVNDEEFTAACKIFEAVGEVEVLPEKLMNSVIAVSGSSPAYVYMLIEAMADGAVRDGIARDKAYRLAAQSVLGSAKMVLETGKHPGELKDMVCSPRGTTIAAVAELENAGYRNAILEAMRACTEKANHIK